MLNLIKMDLYRLIHSVSTRIMIVCAFGLAVMCIVLLNWDVRSGEAWQSYEEMQADAGESMGNTTGNTPESQEDFNVGFHVEAYPEWVADQADIEYGNLLEENLGSGILLVLVSIFVTLFVIAEQKNGFIKNIVGPFPNRGIMVLSKLVSVAVQILLMMGVFALGILFTGCMYWGSRIYLGSVVELLQMFGVEYLLYLAFACLVMCLCILSSSAAFSMTSGILLCSGLAQLAGMLINRIIQSIWPASTFNISNYILLDLVTTGISESMSVLRITVVGLVYVVLSTALAMWVMQKKDIR